MGEHDYAIDQASDIRPPRAAQVLALTVDATSRGYDLTALPWNEVGVTKGGNRNHFFLSVQCEGTGDVYFILDRAPVGTNTIDDTTSIAAGTAFTKATIQTPASATAAPDYTPTYSTALYPAHLVAGLPPVDIRIDRQIDKTLIVKCASGKTATLRFWPSSKNEPGAE